MGQGQSSTTSDAAGGGQEVKTSYYVLLGIERSATEDEIKKAYRRKALELHPDRNYGNEEAATRTFADIQSAYEILSDPQERAWYDSHESAILRGDDAGDAPTYEDVRVTTADDLTRLVRKFNSNVEFSDSPSGFFGFVRETFDQLAKEEEIAANWEDVDVLEYPSFGHKADDYNDVVKSFYAAWGGFSTIKTYSWCDKYRLSEAPDRWMRRRMEQENLRLRKDGRQEFNEAVRALVAFIRKRDPRYVPDTRTEEERVKALRDAAASQAARQRATNAAKLAEDAVPDWAKFREPEELEESEEEESEEEILECVACNKTFKSERQWEAHEKSKKHIKAVKALQKTMRKQNAHLNLDDDEASSGIATPEELEEQAENYEAGENDLEPEKHAASSPVGEADPTSNDAELAEHSEGNGRNHGRNSASSESADAAKKEANAGEDSDDSADSADADYASRETVQARMTAVSLEETPATTETEDDNQPAKPKIGKAAQKRAKKAAAAAAGQQAEADHKCQVCNAGFPSKTKLFQHIQDEGHAALKSATSAGGKGKKKGKR